MRARLCAGAARAAARLSEQHANPCEIELGALACCALSDFDESAIGGTGDTIAGSLARLEGPVTGAAVVSLDPDDAFVWVLDGPETEDLLARFLERVEPIQHELAAALLDREDVGLAPAVLVEGTLAGALASTHAPSDTVVLGVPICLHTGPIRAQGQVALLLEPKLLGSLLSEADSRAA